VRVIAGTAKGTRLAPVPPGVRPVSDRAREGVFSSLGDLVAGAAVLDLFAGTGAMGIEALSRGALRAVFVESDRTASKAIERNLEKLRLTGAAVVGMVAMTALAAEAAAGRRYDLVLVDPPYEMFSSVQTGLARYLPAVLEPGALVVVETAAPEEPELPLPTRTSRRYGSARLTVFTEGQSPEGDSPPEGTVP
jgi:16S rRNA (guanine966-N2)-methyltransferase